MGRLRSTLAHSDTDRELHTHLERASKAVREALRVCKQVTRQRTVEAGPYRAKLKEISKAERLLSDIGYLDGAVVTETHLLGEARALCSWLEGRERRSQAPRPVLRGRDYQARLRAILGFLQGGPVSDEQQEPAQEQVPVPKPETTEQPEGVLWQKAVELARQQGEGDNEAYITTIFLRLARGVTDG